jgi:hypothetical protein
MVDSVPVRCEDVALLSRRISTLLKDSKLIARKANAAKLGTALADGGKVSFWLAAPVLIAFVAQTSSCSFLVRVFASCTMLSLPLYRGCPDS